MEWGRGLEGRKERGKRRDYAPSFLFNLSSPSLLQKLKSPVAVAVNAQLTPFYSPNILQNGAGGGRCSSERAPEANGPLHTIIRMGWGGGSRGGKSFTLSEHSELLRGRVG